MASLKKVFQFPFKRPQSRKRLVFLHHAGGSSLSFLRLARGVSEEYEVLLAEMPGRGFRHQDAFALSIEEYVNELESAWSSLPPKPAIVYGHSLGAIVGYEWALKNSPEKLIVSACRAPQEAHGRDDFFQASDFSDASLLQYMKDFSPIPKDMALEGEEAIAHFLPILRADLLLLSKFQRKKSPLSCDLLAVGGNSDAMVTSDDLDHWGELGKNFQKKIYSGGHFFPWESAVIPDLFSSMVER